MYYLAPNAPALRIEHGLPVLLLRLVASKAGVTLGLIVKAFFLELGLKLEGETTVEGPLVGKLIGLENVRATLAMLRTPDGQGIELDKFHTPNAIRFGPVDAPVNTLGYRRVMFAVDDIDAVVARMRAHGAQLIGEMRYEDTYRLAYLRGPEGIIVALSEQLG